MVAGHCFYALLPLVAAVDAKAKHQGINHPETLVHRAATWMGRDEIPG